MDKLIEKTAEAIADYVNSPKQGLKWKWEMGDFTDFLFDFRRAVLQEAQEKVLEEMCDLEVFQLDNIAGTLDELMEDTDD